MIAEDELRQGQVELDMARVDYEVALQAGKATPQLEQDYRRKQQEYAAAQSEAAAARAETEAAETAAQEVQREIDQVAADVTDDWIVAGIWLALVAGWLLASYRLMLMLRRRESRYQPLGMAAVATGVVLALVYAVDYITDYIDWLDLGPFVLSALGVTVTLVAFMVLQRYLARRVPGRRIRRGECPFCGYPVRGDRPHCEGCGREVMAECASGTQPRRVGSSHCIARGAD